MARNDTDKLVELLFYMLPKYMNGYIRDKNEIKIDNEKDILSVKEIKEIYDVIKELQLINGNELTERKKTEDKEHISRGKEKGKNIKEDLGVKSKKESEVEGVKKNVKKENKVEERKKNSQGKNEIEEHKKNVKKEIESFSHMRRCPRYIENKKDSRSKCGIKNILRRLINKKVIFYISDPIRGVIDNALILGVKNNIVELKTREDTTILLLINEIIGIKSSELISIDFNNEDEISDSTNVFEEDEFRIYFSSIIGKRVFIQTKGCGELRYMNNKIITAVGGDFVVVEKDILISLKKIVLVEL
ncbi:hypothetical protein JMF89_11740 [Clostridiaceae bacterium UIB06]|uniref:Uncharacterized protein n=1 Tax=Clostridium thailandense TaxID=2794346 RepID=A0A949TNT6_9CLOT|nr:hypothetical protein [Clostridium thailandense]MBV7272682.1 hypothetical protein [Clostridium thailandense]MCH5137870.1 hypothetical protein [Clostridiaceae bacterium UIB06]